MQPTDRAADANRLEDANSAAATNTADTGLRREVGLVGAVSMGLGSIIGTGAFVSIGIAAGITGPSVLLAIAVASVVATFNALSSAQLAANLPVSGGTYEYGYHYLRPWLGFVAGWMFLCAKIASAAAAARGFAGYFAAGFTPASAWPQGLIAVVAVTGLTVIVLCGVRRSGWANVAIVSVTVAALAAFVIAGLPSAIASGSANLQPFFPASPARFLEATALMFVAYTGYGRIATLGEEVREPRVTIPRAIVVTLLLSSSLYIAVGFVAIAAVGAESLTAITVGTTGQRAAPLAILAADFSIPLVATLVSLGAMTAMLGVLLNLILGLSRVVLAMGRRDDAPALFAKLNRQRTTPVAAVVLVGSIIATLAWASDIKTAWSFSAFTVLVYYAITNLSAIAMPRDQKLYPRWIPWCGLMSCLGLAFWVETRIWLIGLVILAIGLVFRQLCRWRADRRVSLTAG